jgi:hypothetical protein
MGDQGSGTAESGTAPMARSPEVVTSGIPTAGWKGLAPAAVSEGPAE